MLGACSDSCQWQNWETLGKHARAMIVSGNTSSERHEEMMNITIIIIIIVIIIIIIIINIVLRPF